ncbi:MAG: hypothetical protein KAY82_02110 [Hylemonella sp.]|nr:hypothetical protein [Hylemonella sp.]
MELHQNNDQTRCEITFSFHGLSDREMTLFKSFIRLVDHLVHQHWTFAQGTGQVRVVSPSFFASLGQEQGALLVLGTGATSAQHAISLPIHANDLERELNLLGNVIAVAGPSTAHATAPVVLATDLMHLTRWPTPALLNTNTRERIRLATLMTGRPLTLREIQERSGVPEDSCFEFVNELIQAGLVTREAGSAVVRQVSATATAAIQTGLLARIRSRLGLGLNATTA